MAAAGRLFERALAIYEKALDLDHPERLLPEHRSGIMEMAFEPEYPHSRTQFTNWVEYFQSEPLCVEAEALIERMKLGPKGLESDDPLAARYQTLYARWLFNDGNYSVAHEDAGKALTTLFAANGPNHPWTKDAARITAGAAAALGQTNEAARLRLHYGITDS